MSRRVTLNKNIFESSLTNKIIAVCIAVAVAAAGYVLFVAGAAGFFAAVEPDAATLTTNAKLVSDANASGGQAIQFTAPAVTPTPTPTPTPPPATGSRCPAFPSFPDASCTGVIAGTTLATTSSLTISTPGAVVEAKRIVGSVCITANNVTIRNSKVEGEILLGTGGPYGGCPSASIPTGILFEDVEVMGPGTASTHDDVVSSTFAVSGNDYTCRRCNVHRWGLGFAVKQNTIIEDSYIHDMVGFVGCSPRIGSDCIAHRSCIGGNGAVNVTYRHNRVNCNDLNGEPGLSGAIVIYSQSGHSPAQNVLVEKNYIAADTASYCMYAGVGDVTPTNVRLIDNRFSRGTNNKCAGNGPLALGSGIVLSGNAYTDGVAIN